MTPDADGGDALELDAEALYRAVTKLTRAVQFRDRDAICCQGVSVTQSYALETLVWQGPQSVTTLASHLFLDGSTVSRVIDSLQAKGLVRRDPDPKDRRAVILSPTEEGRKTCARITEEMKIRERHLISSLDPETRRSIIELVGRLAEVYEERARRLASGCNCGE